MSVLKKAESRMHNEVHFQYTEADFRSFMTHHYRKGAGRKVIVLLLGIAFLAGLWPAFKAGFSLFAVGAALFWILFLAGIWYVTLRFTTSRVFKANTQMLEKRRMTFDGQGLQMHGETFSADYKWEHFVKTAETDTQFLLFTSPVSAVILPKRAFSEQQMADLRKAAALV